MTTRAIFGLPEQPNEYCQENEDVNQFTVQVKQIVCDHEETLLASDEGIGLDAPQV